MSKGIISLGKSAKLFFFQGFLETQPDQQGIEDMLMKIQMMFKRSKMKIPKEFETLSERPSLDKKVHMYFMLKLLQVLCAKYSFILQ